MKKLLLTVLILLCICLIAGCSENTESVNGVNIPTDTPGSQTDKTASKEQSIIEFETVAEGNITDSETNESMDYQYRICHVNKDVKGSDEINDKILKQVETVISEQLQCISEGMLCEYYSVDCAAYEYSGMYTLVFSMTRWTDNQREYAVFHFDSETGAVLSEPELLELLGISYFEEYLPAAVKAGKEQIGSADEFPAEIRDVVKDALQRMELYVGQYPVYSVIKPDGKIEAIVPVASMAGADYYYNQLPLNLSIKKDFR